MSGLGDLKRQLADLRAKDARRERRKARPVAVTVRLAEDEKAALDFLARERHMTTPALIRRVAVAMYDAPTCPHCGRHPDCSDRRPDGTLYTHLETCSVRHYSDIECRRCRAEEASAHSLLQPEAS